MGPRTLALVATVLVTGLLAGQAPPPPGQRADEGVVRELERLQGEWKMVALEVNGKKVDDNVVRTWLLVIEGDRYNPGSGEVSTEYAFRIDPTRTPKAIDLIPSEGPYHGKAFRAVYSLNGDRLTVCRPLDPDDDRPAGLCASSRRGSGTTRVVWERRKS
jgi:RNA polymerase sigma-70 factor (ECF subfamily)